MLEKRKYGGTFRQIFSLAGLVQAMVPENSRSTERPSGGESGIRTHGTLRYTRFPSVRLKPLGHLSRSLSPRDGRALLKGASLTLPSRICHQQRLGPKPPPADSVKVKRDMLSRAPASHASPSTRFRSELQALLLLAVPVVLSEPGWRALSIVG